MSDPYLQPDPEALEPDEDEEGYGADDNLSGEDTRFNGSGPADDQEES